MQLNCLRHDADIDYPAERSYSLQLMQRELMLARQHYFMLAHPVQLIRQRRRCLLQPNCRMNAFDLDSILIVIFDLPLYHRS
jgi:hypothetical protein